jgi:hypothetical protein
MHYLSASIRVNSWQEIISFFSVPSVFSVAEKAGINLVSESAHKLVDDADMLTQAEGKVKEQIKGNKETLLPFGYMS